MIDIALVQLFLSLGCELNLLHGVNDLRMGPYDYIRIDNLESCLAANDSSEVLTVVLKMKGSAAGRVGTGYWHAPHPVGEGILGKVVVFQWINGWRKIFNYDVAKDICEEGMNTAPDFMSALANSSGVPAKCPLSEGHHEVVDFPLAFKLEKFPNMPYGRFRIQVNLQKNKKPFCCYFMEGNIDPAAKKSE